MYTLYILECDTQTGTFIRNSTTVHASPAAPRPTPAAPQIILLEYYSDSTTSSFFGKLMK